jgi:hypothetical protein
MASSFLCVALRSTKIAFASVRCITTFPSLPPNSGFDVCIRLHGFLRCLRFWFESLRLATLLIVELAGVNDVAGLYIALGFHGVLLYAFAYATAIPNLVSQKPRFKVLQAIENRTIQTGPCGSGRLPVNRLVLGTRQLVSGAAGCSGFM